MNVNFVEPSGPLQAYNGTALPFTILLVAGSLPLKAITLVSLVEIFSLYNNMEMHARANVESPFGLVAFRKWLTAFCT